MKDIPGSPLMKRMESAMSGIGDGGDVGEVKWNMAAGELWFNKDGWKTVDLRTGAIKTVGDGRNRPSLQHPPSLRARSVIAASVAPRAVVSSPPQRVLMARGRR